MSNVFNAPQSRERFLRILQGRATDTQVEDAFPKPFSYNEKNDTPQTAKGIADEFVALGIPLLKPVAIPDLEEAFLRELPYFNQQLLEYLLENDILESDLVRLPTSDKLFIPKYFPRHWARPYDVAFFKQALFQTSTYESPDSSVDTMRALKAAAEKSSYGNGSYKGQIVRLKAMYNIRHGIGKHHPKTLDQLGFQTFSQVARILDKYLPLGPVMDHPGLRYLPSAYVDPENDLDFLPSINRKSIAGMPWLSKQKGEVMMEALAVADTILKLIKNELLNANNSTDDVIRKVFSEFPYINMGIIFPKAERYDIDEWYTKTRNIWSSPFMTHILMGMLSNEPLRFSPNFMFHDTPSLAHFSPFHGGMQAAIEKLTAPGSHSLVYADNIYFSLMNDEGTHEFYSLDLEKGEANATPDKAMLVAFYLLTRAWVTEDGSANFTPSWAFFAMQIAPLCAVDPLCVLGNVQFQFPGQGSGNSWTFLINHVLSAMLAEEFMNPTAPPGEAPEPFYDDMSSARRAERIPSNEPASWFQRVFLAKMGINCKVERQFHLESELELGKQRAPQNTYISEPAGPGGATNEYKEVELDLLGWSAVFSTKLNQWVPTLERKRLINSTILTRGDETRTQNDTEPAKNRARELRYLFAKNQAIRLVGGHNDWLINETSKILAENYKAQLFKLRNRGLIDDEDTNLTDVIQTTEFSAEFADTDLDLKLDITADFLLDLNRPKMTEAAKHMQAGHEVLLLLKPDVFEPENILNQVPAVTNALKSLDSGRTNRFSKVTPRQFFLESDIKLERLAQGRIEDIRNDMKLNNKLSIEDVNKLAKSIKTATERVAMSAAIILHRPDVNNKPLPELEATDNPANPLPALHLGNILRRGDLPHPMGVGNQSRNARKKRASKGARHDMPP